VNKQRYIDARTSAGIEESDAIETDTGISSSSVPVLFLKQNFQKWLKLPWVFL